MYSRSNFGGIVRFACVFVNFVALVVGAETRTVVTPVVQRTAPRVLYSARPRTATRVSTATASAALVSYGNTFRIDSCFSSLFEWSG